MLLFGFPCGTSLTPTSSTCQPWYACQNSCPGFTALLVGGILGLSILMLPKVLAGILSKQLSSKVSSAVEKELWAVQQAAVSSQNGDHKNALEALAKEYKATGSIKAEVPAGFAYHDSPGGAFVAEFGNLIPSTFEIPPEYQLSTLVDTLEGSGVTLLTPSRNLIQGMGLSLHPSSYER